ncbi:MAG: STAS domain-containing protein [Anaerolineales bacterium]|jgi:stage II sporulation protein AA (anti-sigma F factor antagonist)
MDINIQDYKRVGVVSVSGRIDGATAPEFESRLKDLMQTGQNNMILDMSAVDFMSSSCLRVMLTTRKALMRAGGRFVIAQPSARVTDTLDIAGIDVLFEVFKDREAAVASF